MLLWFESEIALGGLCIKSLVVSLWGLWKVFGS
jgi:hypothetical protein